uniref:Uncharacterized protein n=1 Tax=Arundo donax TaxID=35708 RepID=A0A0A9CW93_ARUDO
MELSSDSSNSSPATEYAIPAPDGERFRRRSLANLRARPPVFCCCGGAAAIIVSIAPTSLSPSHSSHSPAAQQVVAFLGCVRGKKKASAASDASVVDRDRMFVSVVYAFPLPA